MFILGEMKQEKFPWLEVKGPTSNNQTVGEFLVERVEEMEYSKVYEIFATAISWEKWVTSKAHAFIRFVIIQL